MPRRSPTLVLVHVVWATSRRRPSLPPTIEERLFAILGSKAREVGCTMLAVGCAMDHVHVVVRLGSSVSLAELVQRMKGASSRELGRDRSSKVPFAWQDGYWAESLDPVGLESVAEYVLNQRRHHERPRLTAHRTPSPRPP